MKIAFVIDIYPTISTFITNQITGLLDLEHNVYIFPSYKSEIKEGELGTNYGLNKYVFCQSNFVGKRKLQYKKYDQRK